MPSARALGERTYHLWWYICAHPTEWGEKSLPDLRICSSPVLLYCILIGITAILPFDVSYHLLALIGGKSHTQYFVKLRFVKPVTFRKIFHNDTAHEILVVVLLFSPFLIQLLPLIGYPCLVSTQSRVHCYNTIFMR